MGKTVITLNANASNQYVGTVIKKRDFYTWQGLHFAYGTWGGGTLAWYWSPDNGTTFLAMKDLTGTAITETSNDSFTSNFCTGSKNADKITIYVTLSGATSPNLTVGFYDNNN